METPILKFHEEISVSPFVERFRPNVFFKTRQGLRIDESMQRVLECALQSGKSRKLRSFDIMRHYYNPHILSNQVELWQIAALIDVQKNGEEGALVTSGFANAFYVDTTGLFEVHVCWSDNSREWDVYSLLLGGDRFRAARRVFYRQWPKNLAQSIFESSAG